MAGVLPMSALETRLGEYLAMRRALGYGLRRQEKLLHQFLAFLEERGETQITTATALGWAQVPAGGQAWRSYRLAAVRGFARYLASVGDRVEVPAVDLLPDVPHRTVPFIYSEEQIVTLMDAASTLRTPHRTVTVRTLIGLLAVTGMRVGEAIALDRADFDEYHGVLTVRHGKLAKSRELPLHPSTVAAVRGYLRRRDRPRRRDGAVGLDGRHTAARDQRVGRVRDPTRTRRDRTSLRALPPARSRSSPRACRAHDPRRVPRRAGHRPAARAPGHLPRARRPVLELLVSGGNPRADGRRRRAARALPRDSAMTALAPTLEAFFTRRLLAERAASPHTIAAYRDTWRLLLRFAADRTRTEPSLLDIASLISAFLDHLETERSCSARTRNARLAAIRSTFRYAALEHPEHAASIQRVLAITPKRHDRTLVTFLDEHELDALLAAPDTSTWLGRRDHAIIILAAQTGLRATELVTLRNHDLHLGRSAHIECRGKRRKQRVTPLAASTVTVLRDRTAERAGHASDPLFPTRTGTPMTRDALAWLLAKHATVAAEHCPSLHNKRITPHALRHTAAIRLLHAGIDVAVIALWLGHEQIDTTQIYLEADLALKERALERTRPIDAKPGRYRPPDALLAFLEAL
jgi:site-specific recombinase XerD